VGSIISVGFPVYDFTVWYAYGTPALFDENFNPSLNYFAVIDPEGYLAGAYNTKEKRDAWIKKHSAE
jgi:hypothetical protein